MKLMDEKGRLFGVINIIDLCIFAVVVLIIGIVGFKFLGKNVSVISSDSKDVLVQVKCTLKDEDAATALKKGDKLVSGTGFVEAYVQDVSYEAADYTVGTADGRLVLTKHPFLKDIYVTFKMKGNEKSPVLKLGSQEIRVGGKYTVKTAKVEIDGTVDKINFSK